LASRDCHVTTAVGDPGASACSGDDDRGVVLVGGADDRVGDAAGFECDPLARPTGGGELRGATGRMGLGPATAGVVELVGALVRDGVGMASSARPTA
jgi:hypothetical protein